MKRLIPWLGPGLFLITGAAYLLIPKFSLGFNQICEMLATGNTRGLMMFFHSAGSLGAPLSIGIGSAAFLIPALKPEYLFKANNEFFGQPAGILLTFLSAGFAVTVLALLGYSLWRLFPERIQKPLKAVPCLPQLLLLTCAFWMLIRL